MNERFKEERISTIPQSIYSVVNRQTFVDGAIAGQTVGAPISLALTGNPENPLIIGSATIAGIAAKLGIKIGTDWIAMKNRQSALIRESGFSYLFKANSERIIRT